jgi:hypothetical protein
MSLQNIIVVDEKQIMAGSFIRYLKYRLGKDIKIITVADAEHCEREMNSRSQVIVLTYMLSDQYDISRGIHIKNTIQGYDSAMDVIILTVNYDVRTDIVKAIKEMERQANKHIMKNTKKPLTIISATLNNAFIYPIRVFVEEYSIGHFIGLFMIIFTLIGFMVASAHYIFR